MKESDESLSFIIDNNEEYEENNISHDNKLGRIYRNLHDVKARLTFIIDMKKRFSADKSMGRKSDEKELKEYIEIEQDFIKRYISGENPEYHNMIFKTLGEMIAANSYDSFMEYQSWLRALAAEEDLAEDKAKWLVSKTGLSMDHDALSSLIDKFTQSTSKTLEVSDIVRKSKDNYYKANRIKSSKIHEIEDYERNYTHYSVDDHSVDEKEDWIKWVKAYGKNKIVKSYTSNAYSLRCNAIDNHYRKGKKHIDINESSYETKIKDKYAGLKSMEEKLHFLIDYDTCTAANELVYGDSVASADFCVSMRNDFVKQYITNGSPDMINKVYKELAGINYEKTIQMLRERDAFDKEFEKEGEKAGKMADCLIRSTAPGFGLIFSGSTGFLVKKVAEALVEVDKDGGYNPGPEELLENAGINEDMSVREYAVALGITGENALIKYAEKFDADLEDKAYTIFMEKNENIGINKLKARINLVDNNEDNGIENDGIKEDYSAAIYKLKENYLMEYTNAILKKETRELQRRDGFDDSKTKKYGHIVNVMSKEMNTSGLDEWLNEKGGQERIDRMDVTVGHRIINDFEKKYFIKTVDYDQYIRLHTGYEGTGSDVIGKADCLAKAIAANELKKSGAEFSIKKIHKVAAMIKQRPEYVNVINNEAVLDEALTDPSHMVTIADKLFAEPYKVSSEQIEEYINSVNLIYNSIMSKEGRSVLYGAYYDAVKNISDLKGMYDFNIEGDRLAAAERIGELNMALLSSAQSYIKGKEKVRSSNGGKERFGNTLDGLSVLYRYVAGDGIKKSIHNTVADINRVRDVDNTSSKYVDIKKYGAKRAVKAKETRDKGKKPGRQGLKK